MKPLRALLLPLLMLPGISGCTEKKDLSPPPLNPHPEEAVRIRVDFDNPEDAARYSVTMKPLYQNQQRECGYIDHARGGSFVYPEGQFDIPNVSSTPDHAEFVIYLDRYNRETCNWEFATPAMDIHDTRTGLRVGSKFSAMDGMRPGSVYRETCLFINELSGSCWQEGRPVPAVPHRARASLAVRVTEDSAPLRPRQPGYYSRLLQPIDGSPATADRGGANDR